MTGSRKFIRKIVIFTDCDDDDDTPSNKNGHFEYIQRDAEEIIGYSRNTIEYHPKDGSVTITPHYRHFPMEIISLIIHHVSQQQEQKDLYACTLVNQQFYKETNHLLWHSPVISNIHQLNNFLQCLTTSQQQHHVQPLNKLDLAGDFWTDVEFSLLMHHMSPLKQLAIHKETQITATYLPHLPRHCPQLTSLMLDPAIMPDLCVDALARHCHYLNHLTLLTENLPIYLFRRLCVACPLESVEFFSEDHYYAANRLKTTKLVKNIRELSSLKKLVVSSRKSWFPDHFFMLKQPKISSSTDSPWPGLSHLTIHHCTNLTDALLVPFLKGHPLLEHIELYTTVFSDTTLFTIASRLPRLVFIKVTANTHITLDGIHQVVRHCSLLETIDFMDCKNLTTDISWHATDFGRIRRNK